MTRLEAEFVRREAPPSYGQLIAQGLIPPVEDFPVYSASQVSAREHATPQAPGSPAGPPRMPERELEGQVGQHAARLVQGSAEAGGEAWAG